MVFQGSTLVFLWFQSGFYGFSRFHVGFNRYWSFLWFFKVLGWFLMVPGGFSWFFQGSRLVFDGTSSVVMVFHGS